MTDSPSKDDLIKQAWDRWFEWDFSWEGLTKQFGCDGKTLQDYWLNDPKTGQSRKQSTLRLSGELIEVEGQTTYHIVHLPLVYPDGTPTRKTTHRAEVQTQLNSIITDRLMTAESVSTNTDDIIAKSALLQGAIFHDLNLRSQYFKNPINAAFKQCIFTGQTWFSNAVFIDEANFFLASFIGETNFYQAIINGHADFNETNFVEDVYFGGARFNNEAHFNVANFTGEANFIQTTFMYYADFDETSFGKTLEIHWAKFESFASFRYIKWPAPINWRKAFDRTRFYELVDFTGSDFKAFSAFDGIILDKGVRFDRPKSEQAADKQFEFELATAKSDGETIEPLQELEAGCRILKQEMAKQSDKNREQLLYKYELRSRAAQLNWRNPELWASKLYKWSSDYGMSIVRPLGFLLLLTGVFALLYYMLGGHFTGDITTFNLCEPNFVEAMTFSWNRTFAFAAIGKMVQPEGQFGLQFLATIQSALSLVLLFLFALAVRRRFQIS